MSCRGSLEYTCPSHGGWGMVRIGMLIPESHQLFVCPSACGRHGALGAVKQGFKDRLSYLYLEESDIISGYDNAIYEAVEEMLKRLKKRPKVILVFVSCLDDLIGTDCDAVIDELSMRHQDIQFRMGHMNPIATDSDEPPLVSIWKNVYSLMECNVQNRKPAINMLGNYVPVHENSEIHTVMNTLGVKVQHIGNFTNYEELRDMGNNALNLLVSSKVEKVAKLLKRTQGIEYATAHITYDFDEIRKNYQLILDKLEATGVVTMGNEEKSAIESILNESEQKAKEAIATAREKVGNRPIYVDYSAFGKSLEVARFFYEHGFNIQRVYEKDIDEDSEIYQWLSKKTDIEIIKANHHSTVNKWVKQNASMNDDISVGMEAAYISGSRHVAPVFQNEGMYGYHGVCFLMEKLVEAMKEEADLETVINHVGLVV